MRFTIFILFILFAFSACNKDKFTDAPQIKFKRFEPNFSKKTDPLELQPHVIFEITDGDGDLLGDSAKIVIRNTLTNLTDSSLVFPADLRNALGANFKGDVQVGLFRVMQGRDVTPAHPAPFTDTIGFEIYVVDGAQNKSNVIIAEPFYFLTL